MRRTGVLVIAAVLGLSACQSSRPADRLEELVVGTSLEPPHLDPTSTAAAATDEIVYGNVFEGLTRIDQDDQLQPALAKGWRTENGGSSYLFDLHPNVRFHDGTAFTAQTVVFSLNRARARGSTNAQPGLFANIMRVTAVSVQQVRVDLKGADPAFPRKMAWGDAVMVSQASAQNNAQRPVGTGPFRFEKWEPGQEIRLVRWPGYWGQRYGRGASKLSAVRFRFIPDSAAAYGAMMAGDLDGFANMPAPELLPQIQRNPDFKVTLGSTPGETIVALNHAHPLLKNVKVRQAIALAIDRKAVIEGAMFGTAKPIGTFYPPNKPDSLSAQLTAQSAYDPQRARALLKEAGVAKGVTLRLVVPPVAYARRSADIVAAQLKAVGIMAKIEPMEWAQWLNQVLGAKDYDLTIISHTEPDDMDYFARLDNYFNYHSPAFERAITQMNAAPNVMVRSQMSQAAQRQLAQDHAAVFLFELPQIGVWKSSVKGMWRDAPVQSIMVTDVTKGQR